MSEVRVNNLSNESLSGGPTISGITTFSSPYFFVPPQGDTASRPQSCPSGSLRFNTDTAKLEYFKGNTIGWVEIDAELTAPLGGGTGSNTGLGGRMVIGGGLPGYLNTIDFLTISTLGDSQDFGDLTEQRGAHAFASSRTRGINYSGVDSAGDGFTNRIDFITFASTGDATDFGDYDGTFKGDSAGASDRTRAVFSSGQNQSGSPYYTNAMDYLTIATQGNSLDFGDAPVATSCRAACESSTRGFYLSSTYSPNSDIQQVTISTLGNTVDFGNTNLNHTIEGAGGNSVRGIYTMGQGSNVIEYITLASAGNGTDFGDKIHGNTFREVFGSDPTRAVIAGGRIFSGSYSELNVIQYVQIASTGNAVDFGDLVKVTANNQEKQQGGSNTHGGL